MNGELVTQAARGAGDDDPLAGQPGRAAHAALPGTGPQRTQRAVHPIGSTCTTSFRPQSAQKRGGSVAARRRRQRS
jgi:hypothetical protein